MLFRSGSKDHQVFQIPYTLLPEGFLDPKNVDNSRRVMSNHEFAMEYEAVMVSDSEGFFRASVLDKCCSLDLSVELIGDPNSEYIIGIDPNQGGKARCGVVIIRLGNPNVVVRVLALEGETTQAITSALQELCENYKIVRIFMDRGGGGKAVSDLLEAGYGDVEPIIARDDKSKLNLKGRHILDLITFSTSWIADANYATLSLLEDVKLKFPVLPLDSTSDIILDEYDLIEKLKKQCLNIVITQTTSGALHFDTPKKGQNKDLYSALILAGYGVKVLEHESLNTDDTPVVMNTGGLVRNRNSNNWIATNIQSSNSIPSFAIPKKRK